MLQRWVTQVIWGGEIVDGEDVTYPAPLSKTANLLHCHSWAHLAFYNSPTCLVASEPVDMKWWQTFYVKNVDQVFDHSPFWPSDVHQGHRARLLAPSSLKHGATYPLLFLHSPSVYLLFLCKFAAVVVAIFNNNNSYITPLPRCIDHPLNATHSSVQDQQRFHWLKHPHVHTDSPSIHHCYWKKMNKNVLHSLFLAFRPHCSVLAILFMKVKSKLNKDFSLQYEKKCLFDVGNEKIWTILGKGKLQMYVWGRAGMGLNRSLQ